MPRRANQQPDLLSRPSALPKHMFNASDTSGPDVCGDTAHAMPLMDVELFLQRQAGAARATAMQASFVHGASKDPSRLRPAPSFLCRASIGVYLHKSSAKAAQVDLYPLLLTCTIHAYPRLLLLSFQSARFCAVPPLSQGLSAASSGPFRCLQTCLTYRPPLWVFTCSPSPLCQTAPALPFLFSLLSHTSSSLCPRHLTYSFLTSYLVFQSVPSWTPFTLSRPTTTLLIQKLGISPLPTTAFDHGLS